ncbi:MAG: hypothetical protein ABIL50_07575 [candidate division WOR-3 bacterium]
MKRVFPFILLPFLVSPTYAQKSKESTTTKKLPYSVCSPPEVYLKARIAVNPAGKYSQNFRGNLTTYLPVIIKKAQEYFTGVDGNSIKIVGSGWTETPFGTFSKLINDSLTAALHKDDTAYGSVPYLVDILIGEDSYGLVGKIWLINLESETVYETFSYRIPSTAVKDVLQSIVLITNKLAEKMGSILTRIATKETMIMYSVQVVDEADISQDRFVAIRFSSMNNSEGKSLFDILDKKAGVAVRLSGNSKGRITSGKNIGDGWYIIRGENPVVLYQPPDCNVFNQQNPIDVSFEVAAVCPRDNKILPGVKPTLSSGKTAFKVKAPYAWNVSSTVSVSSEHSNVKYELNYILHSKFACRNFIDFNSKFAQTFGLSGEDVLFVSDNFLKNKKIGQTDKGKVVSAKYSDCGVLDPWNLKDPSIDTVFMAAYSVGKTQDVTLRYYINGGVMVSSVGSENTIFDLLGMRVVGGDRVRFSDVPVYINDPLVFRGGNETILSFKPFSATMTVTTTFTNSGCGSENLTITVQSTFKPIIECDCVAHKFAEENK